MMVKVKESESFSKADDFCFDVWLDNLTVSSDYKDKIEELFNFVSNEIVDETKSKGMKVACMLIEILLDLNLDLSDIQLGILYHFVFIQLININIVKKFDENLYFNILELQKLEEIDDRLLQINYDNHKVYDGLRKMLLATVKNIKIVLIKLSYHTCILRNSVKKDVDYKKRLGFITNQVYAPLVNRLGIGQLKWEMEDLSFRFLHPEKYKEIAKHLDETRIDREKYIVDVKKKLTELLKSRSIKCELTSRVKHIYSIWKKMERKRIEYKEIYDIRALRIIVNNIEDCYASLGVVHTMFHHIPKEFDDYIANPKPNGYQSIHTAVRGPENKIIEIQIRTKKMHEQSEIGVAAHWKYKEGGKLDKVYESKITQLQQLLNWHKELSDSDDLLQLEFFKDRVYLFTPKGDVIELPEGATPVDFAYHVHTEVGHRCRGAKLNGKIINLSTPLENGQQVEVITVKEGGPSRDWLSSNYVKTARARVKILSWFKKQDKEKNIQAGKDMIIRELKKLCISNVGIEAIFKKFTNYKTEEEFLSAVGFGIVKMTQIIGAIQHINQPKFKKTSIGQYQIERETVYVDGVGKLKCYFAKCCKPLPGEKIIGYITSERGVSVHKYNCKNIKAMLDNNLDKLVDVNWGVEQCLEYSVDLILRTKSNKNKYLRSITKVMDEYNIKVKKLSFLEDKNGKVNYQVTIEIENIQMLSKLIDDLLQINGIEDASRYIN